MKTLRSLLLLTAFAVVALFVGAPFVMEINPLVDTPSGLIVVAEPAPPIAVAPPVDERSHLLPGVAANVPLGKSLILREAVPVRTKYGAVTVGAGTPVRARQRRGRDEGATRARRGRDEGATRARRSACAGRRPRSACRARPWPPVPRSRLCSRLPPCRHLWRGL